MDAETMLTATWYKFAKEDYTSIDLLHADMEIVYPFKLFLHADKLVVVSGEHHHWPTLLIIVQIFGDGPRNRYAVVGRRTAAYLVQQHQRPVADVVQDTGRLVHLHQEG